MNKKMPRNVNKIVATISLFVAMMLCVVGCAGQVKEIDESALAEQLVSEIEYDSKLTQVDDFMVSLYVTMEEDTTGIMYMSNGATAEAVAVFTAPDEDTAVTMKDNVQFYLNDQETAFEDYMPDEAKRIQDAVLVQKGKYVILCVTGDTQKAETIIEDAFK